MPFDYTKQPAPITTQCPDCGGYPGLKPCPSLCDDCYGNMHTGAACGPCTCPPSGFVTLTTAEVEARRRSAYAYAF